MDDSSNMGRINFPWHPSQDLDLSFLEILALAKTATVQSGPSDRRFA
jgi:hypothetical protein